jgi:hypothetical protein
MEKKNVSRKALETLLSDSMRDAIGHLELPKPSKKIMKLVSRSAKKLASEFTHILKKENKKSKKIEKSLVYVEDVLKGKKDKVKRKKKVSATKKAAA